MSNTVSEIRNRKLQDAFILIKKYTTDRKACAERDHVHAARWKFDFLHQLYLKKMTQYLSHLRNVVVKDRNDTATKRNVFKMISNRSTRAYFLKWKNAMESMRTVEEVNREGPVTEEVLDHQIDLKNCQNFMRDQGYTEKEIEEAVKKTDTRAKTLMARAIARFKHYTEEDDLYLKPKMFDRWVMYVKMRKLLRHWLQYIENRQKHHKADLAAAFDRWKYHYPGVHNAYSRETRDNLLKRAVENGKRLQQLADSNGENEELLTHLGKERDLLKLQH